MNHEAATPHSPNDSIRTAVALELPNDHLILKPSVSASHQTENSLQVDLIGLTEADISKVVEVALLKYYRLHNLSRFAQYVELDLSRYRGRQPVEMIGRVHFPRVGDLPYLLTLGPHDFFWFELTDGEG